LSKLKFVYEINQYIPGKSIPRKFKFRRIKRN